MNMSDRRAFLKTAGAAAATYFVAPRARAQSKDDRLFNVAVIGSTGRGDYGHGIDLTWRDVPHARIVAVADEDEAGRSKAVQRTGAARSYADYRKMLDIERPEVVAIAPRWLDRHHEMCMAAIERGCHVFMEKPFCRDLSEADEIVAACEKHHTKLAIAHQTRWAPAVEVVRRELANGIIGQVLEVRTRGKEDARGGGQDLWVLGSHVLDLMRLFAGDPLTCFAQVRSQGRIADASDVHSGAEGLGPIVGDEINAMFSLPAGVAGYFGSRRGAAGDPSRFGLQIFGSEGVIEVLTGHPATCHVLVDASWSPGRSGKGWVPVSSLGVGKAETLPEGLHHGNVLAANDLIECIRDEKRQPKCSVEDARWTVEMIASVFESHRQQGPVKLPLERRVNPLASA